MNSPAAAEPPPSFQGRLKVAARRFLLIVSVFAILFIVTSVWRIVSQPTEVPKQSRVVIASGNAAVGINQERPAAMLFFSNGSAMLTPADYQILQSLVPGIQACKGVRVEVSGEASSAPFKPGSPKTNVGLANERADTVIAVLTKKKVEAIRRPRATQTDLDAQRRYADVDGTMRLKALEAFNRRADIFLRGGCVRKPPLLPSDFSDAL